MSGLIATSWVKYGHIRPFASDTTRHDYKTNPRNRHPHIVPLGAPLPASLTRGPAGPEAPVVELAAPMPTMPAEEAGGAADGAADRAVDGAADGAGDRDGATGGALASGGAGDGAAGDAGDGAAGDAGDGAAGDAGEAMETGE